MSNIAETDDDENLNSSHEVSDQSSAGLRRRCSDGIIRDQNKDIRFTMSLPRDLDRDSDYENKKICNNYRFGFKKWKGHVTSRPLHTRSKTVQNLYADVNTVSSKEVSSLSIVNIIYLLLFGWWQSLVYFFLGIVLCLTFLGRNYGLFCFKMSRYYLWPFSKFIYRVSEGKSMYSFPNCPSSSSSDTRGENRPLLGNHMTYNSPLEFWGRPQTYVWLVLGVPILVVMHFVAMVISWLFVISIPVSKMNLKSISRLLFLPPEQVCIADVHSDQENSQHHKEIIMFIPKAVNIYYYKYTVDGVNIILVNLLLFVIFTIVFGYTEMVSPAVKCVLGTLAIVPLSYYIGMAITSLSAQTSVAMGAVMNALFGIIVEVIIFLVALNQGKKSGSVLCFTEIVKASLSGTIICCTLLIPGISMIVGGLKYPAQSFNPKSAGVSCLLMFVCVGGIFAPTIFSQVLGDMYCVKCENMYKLNNTNNQTYGLNCEQCTNSIFGVDQDPTLYNKHIKPLVYAICVMLPIAYIVGLFFTLKTHASHLTVEFTKEQMERDSSSHEGHSHGSPQWGIIKSILILLFAATLIGVSADIVTENLQSFLLATGLSTYFVSVTFLSLIPALPEIVNGVQFALQNNVNLGIEIGTSVAIQVCAIEIPILVLINIIFPFELYMVFNQVHLWAVFFAVIVINYTLQDGKSDYFQGTALLFIYLILLCMYFFMPSPGTCSFLNFGP